MKTDIDGDSPEQLSRPLREVELAAVETEPEPSNGTRLAKIDQDGVAAEGGVAADGGIEAISRPENKYEEPVTWASLPHRDQLIILTLARLSEPLVQTSLQASPSPL
jgi:hypothetical protein